MNNRFYYLLSLVVICIFVYLQISHYLDIPVPYQEPDSIEFLNPSSAPQAWGSVKPPFVPLVYKILGGNIDIIVVVQLLFSLFSWSFLSYAVSRSLRCAALMPVAFILILGLGLSDEVSMWNKSILSESICLSLLACLAGIWILFINNINVRRGAALIIISTMFALTRTANGFALLMVSPILIAAVLFNRQPIQRRCYLSIAIAFLILFLASNSISNTNNRWAPYFLNVVSKRILTNQEMRKYFEDQGMPVTDSLMARSGKWSHEDNFAYYNDPGLEQFRNWLYTKGKSAYTRYLLTHPAYSISEPLLDFHRMMFSTQVKYYAPKGFTSPLQGKLFDYLSSWSLFTVYVFFAGVLFGLNLMYALSKKFTVSWIPLVMLFLVFPLAALAWHGDAMEIERHALPVAVQAHLGFILLLLFTTDAVLFDSHQKVERT